jgi:hypothetical protein
MSFEKTLSGPIATLPLPLILSNNLDNDNLVLRRAISPRRLGY